MSLKMNLINYMKDQNITIKELATQTGISEPTLKRLRTSDTSNPTLEVLMQLARALKVTLPQLIDEKIKTPVVYQNKFYKVDLDTKEFIFVFTKQTFNFIKGTQAVFKIYAQDKTLTKYIITQNGQLLEKINDKKMLFQDEEYKTFSVTNSSILAFITKELYEVNYV